MQVRSLIALGMALAAPATVATPAVAATTLGQTGNGTVTCVGPAGWTQQVDGSGNSYVVPPGGGVITSWSTPGGTGNSTGVVFALLTGPGPYTVHATDEPREVTGTSLNTFSVRMPVDGGERLGYYHPGAWACSAGSPEDGFLSGDSDQAPPVVGDPVAPTFGAQARLNLSATLEADADGDDFGDETQDRCVGVSGDRDGCPAPVSVPLEPGQPAPPPVAAARDTTPPVLTEPRLSSSVFSVDLKARAAAKGTRLGFSLSEPATVVFVTEQRVGRRWRKVRIFGRRFPARKNTFDYSGKIKPRGKQRALKPGRYRIRMRPSDRAGNKGIVSTVGFRIAK